MNMNILELLKNTTNVNKTSNLSLTTVINSTTRNSCPKYLISSPNVDGILNILNHIHFVIIIAGIMLNILNIIVLLKAKLNESPYTYLTALAFSDIGALLMALVNCLVSSARLINDGFVNYYLNIYFLIPFSNIFLSYSMFVTLALTIERFIFVHSPFKAVTVCRKSIARKVCLCVAALATAKTLYLPFMYKMSDCDPYGLEQHKSKSLDIFEFLISLAIPYTIILVINISLVCSLNKKHQNIKSSTSTYSFDVRMLPMIKKSKSADNIGLAAASTASPGINNSPSFHSNLPGNNYTFKTKLKLKTSASTYNYVQIANASEASSNGNNHHTHQANCKHQPDYGDNDSCYRRTSNEKEIRNQKKLTISLIAILMCLLMCHLPSFLMEESFVEAVFGDYRVSEAAFLVHVIGTRVAIILIYVNCTANFIIYCISNKKFSNSIRILLKNSKILNLLLKKCTCYSQNLQMTLNSSTTNSTIIYRRANSNTCSQNSKASKLSFNGSIVRYKSSNKNNYHNGTNKFKRHEYN